MGMFDTIKCEYALPMPDLDKFIELKDINFSCVNWQTKDLDCQLSLYKIDSNGLLWIDKKNYIYEDSRGYLDLVTKDTENDWQHVSDFTGSILFYDAIYFDAISNSKNDYFIEYISLFVKGKLTHIELKNIKCSSNSERLILEADTSKYLKDISNFRNKWYMKYLYIPYSEFINRIFMYWRKFIMKFSSYKIQRFLTPL